MELDAETIQALGYQSSWDMWEFSVWLHTSQLETREATRERVAEHRRWNREAKKRARSRERDRYLQNRDLINERRRARAKELRMLDPAGQLAKERLKWEKRKAKMVASAEALSAKLPLRHE